MATPSVVVSPSADHFARDLMAHCVGKNAAIVTHIGNTAYRVDRYELRRDVDGTDQLTVTWVKEDDLVKACTIPWRWRLKWRLRNLARKVI